VVYVKLPAEQRNLLGRQLARLLHKYMPMLEAAKTEAKRGTRRGRVVAVQ
jgi:hypothetical protein